MDPRRIPDGTDRIPSLRYPSRCTLCALTNTHHDRIQTTRRFTPNDDRKTPETHHRVGIENDEETLCVHPRRSDAVRTAHPRSTGNHGTRPRRSMCIICCQRMLQQPPLHGFHRPPQSRQWYVLLWNHISLLFELPLLH